MAASNFQEDIPPKAYAPITATQISGRVCDYCLQPPKSNSSSRSLAKIAYCTMCHRTGYCDAVCQKKDWKVHKHICSRLKMMDDWDKAYGEEKLIPEGYNQIQDIRMAKFTEPTPEKPYGSFPSAYITDQVKCDVCFRTPFQLSEIIRFPSCERCHLSWWCSPECGSVFAKHHTRSHCDERFDVTCVDRFKIDFVVARRARRQFVAHTNMKHPKYTPLSSLKDWDDYHRKLYPNWEYCCRVMSQEFAEGNQDPERALRLLTTESTAYPLTVLAGLEHAYKDISQRTHLLVHVVGAGHRESSGQGMTEEILHCLPKLRHLHFWLIGNEDEGVEGNFACDTCKPLGIVRTTNYYIGDYQDFMTTGPGAKGPAPDLVVGLNTGMSEVDTERWTPALNIILARNIPAVFTAYTRSEAKLEEVMWRRMGARFLKSVEKNKWRGVVPQINHYLPEEGKGHTTLYNSHYWYMIQGKA